jgi:hypothetical protein
MNHADVSDAARLLRLALAPKQRPVPASQYRELLDHPRCYPASAAGRYETGPRTLVFFAWR